MTGPANSTISGLTAVSSIDGTEVLPVDQTTGANTITKKSSVLTALEGTVGNSSDSAKGDALVAGKKTDLTNAMAFTLHGYNQRRVVNLVTDYGADNTGVTNASTALQNAIDDLPLNTADVGILTPKGFPTGGTIFIPRGKYRLNSKVTLHRGIRIVGEGREATQLISYIAADSVLQYQDAGRYIQDEIVIENLSVWQDDATTATSGAAIDIIDGVATTDSVFLKVDNVLIRGAFRGIRLGVGVGCSVKNANVFECVESGIYINPGVSTTSTVFENTYSHINGKSGFEIYNSAYVSFVSCASDSNTEHGFYVDGSETVQFVASGAEGNTLGAYRFKDCSAVVATIYAIDNDTHAVELNNTTHFTLLGGYLSGAAGYGIHLIASGGQIAVIGTVFADNYATNKTDTTAKFLNLTDDNGLVGYANKWAIGNESQPDTTTQFNVGGSADSDTDHAVKINVEFTGADATRNTSLFVQPVTANTAVTYPLIAGAFIPAMSKGAASTVTRLAGAYLVQQTAGGTANANLMIDAGSGTVPAGAWSIYNDSTRENLFKGPIRWTSSTGQLDTLGAATPESATTAPIGSIFRRTDGGYGNAVYVKENGSSNTGWSPVVTNRVSADKGDAAATLTVGTSEQTAYWNTALTVDRAVTLSTTGAHNGAKFRVVRSAASTGAFNLNVGTGPLKALATGQWCDVEYNGSAWVLTAFGSL